METLKLLRWTVVGRETDELGRLLRGTTGYKRTEEPQEEREEQFIRFTSRLRVMVSWGGVPVVATAEFSLTSGRCIGHPDWILRKEQLKLLRKLARLEFPKEAKSDDESKASGREETPPAETSSPAPVDPAPARPASRADEPATRDRQRNLF